VAYSPDGKVLASSGAGGSLQLWDAQNGRETRRIPGLSGFVPQVAFSPDGKSIAALDERGAGLWDLATAQELPWFSKLPRAAFDLLSFGADRKTLALSGRDGIFLWDIETDRELKRTSESPVALALSPDGNPLAWGADSGGIRLWNWKESTFINVAPGRTSDDGPLRILAIAFSRDGKTLASAGEDNRVTLRDPVTGKERKILAGHEAVVTSLAFAPDGKTLASGSIDGTVLVWDLTLVEKP
jgi:WD40 repeat protein